MDTQILERRKPDGAQAAAFNQPFTIRGKRALLLGVFDADEGCVLRFLYENGDRPPPDLAAAYGTVRAAVFARLNFPFRFRDPVKTVFFGDEKFPVRKCVVTTAGERFDAETTARLAQLAERHGLPGLTGETMNVAEASFWKRPDFDALRGAGEFGVTLVFGGAYPFSEYLCLPFRLPANLPDGHGPVIEYSDRLIGRTAVAMPVAVRRLPLRDAADLDRLCRFLRVDPDGGWGWELRRRLGACAEAGVVFVEYTSVPERFLEIYLSDFLERPLNGLDKAVVGINSLLEKDPSRRICCAGLVIGEAAEYHAELVACHSFMPEEVVEVMTKI